VRKKHLAIIGNGMATCRLLDELKSRDALGLFEVTVFGEEPGGAYNRILLGRVLSGEEPDAIVTKPRAWYAQHGVRLIDDTRVVRLDTVRKTLLTEQGDNHRYDVAVIAAGSQPLVPPLPGMTLDTGDLRPGVFVYRKTDDCLRMREFIRPGDSAVVIGGGLLGLEAAKVLSDRGLHVTVVHVAQWLMNAQLDPIGGDMLLRQIERCGIFVRTEKTVDGIYGDDGVVQGVTLDDGSSLPADLVVLACGVRPRIDLGRLSSLPINKGIVVNDVLATEAPGVYALGECAEHRGRLYGIVNPVWEQAAVLADVLSGKNPQARYSGSKLYTRLKVAGVEVASMGLTEPELEDDTVLQIIEERRNAYRKLIVRDGRLLGAMLVGHTAAGAALVQMFDRDDPLPEDPLEVLCASTTSGAAQRERTICNCHRVSETALRDAIEQGADSLAALGSATRAGTGCGSCKAELTQLIVRHAKKPKPAALAAS
jgi:nitrite reductase (NADH) large subunit